MNNEQYQGNGLPNINPVLSGSTPQSTNSSNSGFSNSNTNNISNNNFTNMNSTNDILNMQPVASSELVSNNNGNMINQNNSVNNNFVSSSSPSNIIGVQPVTLESNNQISLTDVNNSNQLPSSATTTNENNINMFGFSTSNEGTNSVRKMPEMKDTSSNLQSSNTNYNSFDIGLTQSNFNSGTQDKNNTGIQTIVPNNLNNITNDTHNINDVAAKNNSATVINDINLVVPPKNDSNDVVGVSEYLKYIVIFSIPIVGLVVLFKKAFSNKTENPNIKNFAKAKLILLIIMFILGGVISFLASSAISSSINNARQSDGTTSYYSN